MFSTPRNLGVKEVDSNGRVTFTFNTAGLGVGAHTIQIKGLQSGIVLRASFTVVAAGAGTGSGTLASGGTAVTSGSGSGLAFTGSNAIVPLAFAGGVLLAVGGGAVVAGRRRNAQ